MPRLVLWRFLSLDRTLSCTYCSNNEILLNLVPGLAIMSIFIYSPGCDFFVYPYIARVHEHLGSIFLHLERGLCLEHLFFENEHLLNLHFHIPLK